MAQKKPETKKKKKLAVDKGVVHIQSTYNNTIVTISDTYGNTLARSPQRLPSEKKKRLTIRTGTPRPIFHRNPMKGAVAIDLKEES